MFSRLALVFISLPAGFGHWCENRRQDNLKLWCAAAAGDVLKAQRLIHEGADPNDGDAWDKTPLIYAAETGELHVVSLLLANGANVEATDWWGHTALMRAAESGNLQILQRLVRHGAWFDPWMLDDSKGGAPFWIGIKDEATQKWWRSHMTTASLVTGTLLNYKTYASVFIGALLALPLVLGARYFRGLPLYRSDCKIPSYLPVDMNRKRGYFVGAKLIVGKVHRSAIHSMAILGFRALEAVVNLVGILGCGMMVVWWRYWLPLVCFTYLGPAMYSFPKLALAKPILVMAVQGPLTALIALLRVFLLCLVAVMVWKDYRIRHPDLSSSMQLGASESIWTFLTNPMQEQVQVKMHSAWTETSIPQQAALGRILEFFASAVVGLTSFYATCLVLYLLCIGLSQIACRRQKSTEAAVRVDADSSFQDTLGQVMAALPEERSWPHEARPEVCCQASRLFDSLAVKLSLHVLAVVMDLITIFTMASARSYFLSLALTCVLARAMVQEMFYGNPVKIREAVLQSALRGILREDLMQVLEEKAVVSAQSLALTAYSLYFCVQVPFQAYALLVSMALSVYTVGGFLYEQIDLNLVEGGEPNLPAAGRAIVSL
ncbi:mask [Symbiodinium natans]|uniref:Mask protein n=1 Tax=Symbiodinium natans TaxID=878477 RepID=A0A812MQT9_9DINO|nr:mask [Symbiodinium natans]